MCQPGSPTDLYPEDDGIPLSEGTLHFEWIERMYSNIRSIFCERPDVFVACDLLWYHEEGNPNARQAPDTMVVFGRPKGHRRTYLQWQEGNIAPQVVIEIRAPSNDEQYMANKLRDYDAWGVLEYFAYDPERNLLLNSRRNAAESAN